MARAAPQKVRYGLPQTEKDLKDMTIRLLKMYGWKRMHLLPTMIRSGRWVTAVQGDPGFPDVIAIRPPRYMVAEFKSPTGKTTPEQDEWLAWFRGCPGVEAYVWRPEDWPKIQMIVK